MSGNKILERIKSDCDKNIEEIEIETAKKCSKILAKSKIESENICSDIAQKTDEKLKQIKAMSKSRAELEARNVILNKKRSEIDITLKKILEHLTNQNESNYFQLVYKLASKLSSKSGEIHFNSRDISRLPSDFIQKLKANGLDVKICKSPVDITGGFIFKHGDIEENMDFSALISANQDKLIDLINRELFVTQGGN